MHVQVLDGCCRRWQDDQVRIGSEQKHACESRMWAQFDPRLIQDTLLKFSSPLYRWLLFLSIFPLIAAESPLSSLR